MIDCHSHLSLAIFDHDREGVIERAQQAGVDKILLVGESLEDSVRVLAICARHPVVLYPCIGIHPDSYAENRIVPTEQEIQKLIDMIRAHHHDIVGIGEIGLDYWAVKTEDRRLRQSAFLSQMVDLAEELSLPLNVHSRSAGHYALDLLAQKKAERVLMHAFDGKASYAKKAVQEYGWTFAIPPSIVRSKQKQKLVSALPLTALVLESDSPALGPDRETRNEPANLIHTVRAIAEIEGESEKTVIEATTENARRLFAL